jgi:hypothetical protein
MKQNYIFVFILLATLSIVNSIPHQLYKRETTFAPCPTGSPNIIKVSIEPDPPPTTGIMILTISGTLKTGIISVGSQLVIKGVDNAGELLDNPLVYDICNLPDITCPTNYFSIKKSIELTNIYPTYSNIVQILSASGQILACSIGTVTGN